MNKKFGVLARYPAISRQHNEFLKLLDLGIEGAYILKTEEWNVSFNPEKTNPEKIRQSIKYTLESLGCLDIYIWIIQD